MAGHDTPPNPAASLRCKEKGNQSFQAGDYQRASDHYTEAISHDPTNPVLYTNRAMALLKISNPPAKHHYELTIQDSQKSISLLAANMKAYYQLAQAQIALKRTAEALASAKEAHRLCVLECRKVPMGKGSSSIGPITELVLRCKREWWEAEEDRRVKEREPLLRELEDGMRERCAREKKTVDGDESAMAELESAFDAKMRNLQSVFERASIMDEERRRRQVPEWIIDNISFAVMLDPVVTKTGQSYDRSSIMEHLKRSQTDPLTREPLTVEDLRPNLVLKDACEKFLEENGWAVDW